MNAFGKESLKRLPAKTKQAPLMTNSCQAEYYAGVATAKSTGNQNDKNASEFKNYRCVPE
jgi:hypothetical protein